MTYHTVRTPPVKPHDAPAKPLPPHVPYAVRARKEAALRKALDGTARDPQAMQRDDIRMARMAWFADLPEGPFAAPAAAAAWGVSLNTALCRLRTLVTAGLLDRTPVHKRPACWWRAESPPE